MEPPVSHAPPEPPRYPAEGRPASGGLVVLALLGLVPVVFVRGGVDAFEPHKAALLATGAAALLAMMLARQFARIDRDGFGGWWRGCLRRGATGLRSDPLGAAVLLFLVSAALSTLAAPRPALGLFGVPGRPAGLVTALATAAVYFASRSAAESPRWLERVSIAASAAGAAASAYALLQLAGLDPIRWEWTATFDGRARVPGTLGHPNNLGAYLAMSLPLTVLLATRARSLAGRAGWGALALVGVLVLATTLSRGGWLGLAAGIAAYGVVSIQRRRDEGSPRAAVEGETGRRRTVRTAVVAAVAAAVFLVPLATPMGPSLLTRIRQVGDLSAPTTQSRLLIWKAGIRMAADHPLLGVGTDSFGAAFPHYRPADLSRVEWNAGPSKAHNELVQVAATQGLVGLVAALLVLLAAAGALLRLSRHPDPGVRAGAAAAGAALAAWAVSSTANFTVAATGCLAAAVGGWVAGQARATASSSGPAATPPDDDPPPPRAGALQWTAALLVAALLWSLLVLTPWRAAAIASTGLAHPDRSPARVAALARASAIAPWEERHAFELGRTLLVQAFAAPDPPRAWDRLVRARRALERAVRLAPSGAEDRAFLARAIAAQAALRPDLVNPREAAAALDRALAVDSTGAGILALATQGYMQIGRSGAARRTALRCARLYPDFAVPMADLGALALEEGRVADAADTLALALELRWHDFPDGEAIARGSLENAKLRLGR